MKDDILDSKSRAWWAAAFRHVRKERGHEEARMLNHSFRADVRIVNFLPLKARQQKLDSLQRGK